MQLLVLVALETSKSSFKVQRISQVRYQMEEARSQHQPRCLQAESLSVPLLPALEGVLCLERVPVEHSSSA